MTPDNTSNTMPSPEEYKPERALTYSEMMNEGRKNLSDGNHQEGDDLQKRVEELERKVNHLEKVIQRQLRLGRMVD
ncbi:hypothetical protein MITS9509_02684 [Synechococcus sp. MIT S9509]|nr:hypothetical protein [Synechococcus sp. MIT S9509]KZR85500.1 hypothetical protein MITS9504_02037 [Synechococcus sp. MIT S9504]KZR90395.1 hypothetical protein MITS9509_02684 [Synechococcus sp. MIT S9509]